MLGWLGAVQSIFYDDVNAIFFIKHIFFNIIHNSCNRKQELFKYDIQLRIKYQGVNKHFKSKLSQTTNTLLMILNVFFIVINVFITTHL